MSAAPEADPDAADVLAAAQGDGAAFAGVFERLGPAAWSFARRLTGDATAAEDAVQDAFLRLFDVARRGLFDPRRGAARAFLLRLVRNATVDARRRTSRERAPLDEVERPGPDFSDAARLGVDAAAGLALLPEPWRAALLLRIDQGLAYDDIAVALDATNSQVKTWIFRARAALAARLDHPALTSGGRHDV
jgi:RNA polymerase sigma-70 factor, ECF subfamily